VRLPISFELQNHHDTIRQRKEDDAHITATTRARRITSASDTTSEALPLQAESRTGVNTPLLPNSTPFTNHHSTHHPSVPQKTKRGSKNHRTNAEKKCLKLQDNSQQPPYQHLPKKILAGITIHMPRQKNSHGAITITIHP
jgi:hypothetical protein